MRKIIPEPVITTRSDELRIRRPISNLRWWIGGILLASTIINYLDRQSLSLLAPYLKIEYHWTNTDYANIVIGFRLAYSIGQTVFGRFMDRIGTRRGLSITVVFYSLVSVLTSLARGFYSFATFRFLLGAGESANWPAATKAVSEWFPARERGLATALFDSGSSVGGAIASWLILSIYFRWGWRPAFAIPGMLGFVWVLVWRWLYHPPETHPRISDAERAMILADKHESPSSSIDGKPLGWRELLSLPQTWGAILAKALTDPVWFFVTDWFPIYLVAKGIELRSGLIAIWIPFLAADLGNFCGGIASGYLIKLGWSVGKARKAVVVFGGLGVTVLIGDRVHCQSLPTSVPFCSGYILLCSVFNHGQRLTLRSFSQRVGRERKWAEWNGGGPRHRCRFQTHWTLFRRPQRHGRTFLRSHCHRGRLGSSRGDDSGLAISSQHRGHQARLGSANLR